MKTVEEIRQLYTRMTQADFARELGISPRTYQTRITHSDWHVDEIVKASKHNNGEVKVNVDGVDYDITVREG